MKRARLEIACAIGMFMSGAFPFAAHAQQQSQGPDETSMTLLGQCVYNNNANSIRAVTMQRQMLAMQEQERATAEYWARWIGEKKEATGDATPGSGSGAGLVPGQASQGPVQDGDLSGVKK